MLIYFYMFDFFSSSFLKAPLDIQHCIHLRCTTYSNISILFSDYLCQWFIKFINIFIQKNKLLSVLSFASILCLFSIFFFLPLFELFLSIQFLCIQFAVIFLAPQLEDKIPYFKHLQVFFTSTCILSYAFSSKLLLGSVSSTHYHMVES